MKVALYSRVSHEEQLKGYSIQAQRDELEKYAKEHGYEYEHYTDGGYSGGKIDRPELKRLLSDVEKDRIKLILFCKLDRWFRSVSLYYKIQDVLDTHKCAWVCIQEDYETETSSGRFKVNIMLSVAENERLKTGERIKAVFKNKIENGYAIVGVLPVGFGLKECEHGKKVICTNPDLVKDLVTKTDELCSLEKAREFINSKYNLNLSYSQVKTLISSSYVYGEYKDVQIFEPIVPKNDVLRILNQMSRKCLSNTPQRQYIFKSLLVCPVCGNKLHGALMGNRNIGYRCAKSQKKQCTFNRYIGEKKIEKYISENLMKEAEGYIIEKNNKPSLPKVDKNKIKAKIKRLNDMYLEDKCTKEYFDEHYYELIQQLSQEEPKNDNLKEIIEGNAFEIYDKLNKQEKNFLLRRIIKSIDIVEDSFKINWL